MNILELSRTKFLTLALTASCLCTYALCPHTYDATNTFNAKQNDATKLNKEKILFSNKDAQYRIPAIVECKSGKIIAFADHRYDNKDIGGGRHIDIVMKESKNQGTTWTDTEHIIAKGGNRIANSFDCAHGDAAAVVDWKSGEVLLMCASGGIGYWESNRANPQMMGRYYSNDEGKTWKAREVTNEIYGLMDDMTSAFFTSGRICQSHQIKVGSHYRLYAALTTHKGNRVLYSDDFGNTWAVLGSNADATAPKGDEAKLVELPDGNVLISSRTQYGRFFNIFKYTEVSEAKGMWDEVAMSSVQNRGVRNGDSACNGEIICVKAEDCSGKKVDLLLQSVPTGPERSNVSIFYKALRTSFDYATPEAIARDWEGCYQVSNTTSAYSTMAQTKKGDIIFLYEENAFRHPEIEPDDYYDIVFKAFTIREITAGEYQ